MAKKIISLRLKNETINYLNNVSLNNGIHHKLSKELPNITKTIELIIENYKKHQEPLIANK